MRKGLSSKALAIVLCMGLNSAASPGVGAAALEIHAYRQSQQVACVNLPDDRFSLSFIHSVSLTPVRDEYHISHRNGHYLITQTAEKFIAHGQGLPSMKDEPNATGFFREKGHFILKLNRPIQKLIVRTDQRYENRLHAATGVVNLNQWDNMALWIKPVNACPARP